MNLKYTLWDPTKNITILVSSPVGRIEQPKVAEYLMKERPFVEQVGFLEKAAVQGASLHLQMMGGEFCGNAAMSAGAYVFMRDGTKQTDLQVSGSPDLVKCLVEPLGEGEFKGSVSMPLPEKFAEVEIPGVGQGPAVFFNGIVHCIVGKNALTKEKAEDLVRPLSAKIGADALGLLFFDEESMDFKPLVYVAKTDTAVWESGCGSGSAALGAYLAFRDKKDWEAELSQPGGVVKVSAKYCGGGIAGLTVTGHVRLLETWEGEI